MSCCCGGSGKGCKQQNQCDSWTINDGSEYQEEINYKKASKHHSLFNIGSSNINFIITTEHPCRQITRGQYDGVFIPYGYTYSFTKIIFLDSSAELLPPDITIACDGAIAAYYYCVAPMNKCNFAPKCCKCRNGGYYNGYVTNALNMPADLDYDFNSWSPTPYCISQAAPFIGSNGYVDGISFPKASAHYYDLFGPGGSRGSSQDGSMPYYFYSAYRQERHGDRQRVPRGSCNTKFTYQNQGEVLDFTSTHFDSIYRYTYGNNLGALGEKNFEEEKKTSPQLSEVSRIYTTCNTYYFVYFQISFLPTDLKMLNSYDYTVKVPSFLRCDAKFDIINHDSNKCNKEYTDQYLIEPHYICSNKRFFL